MKSRHLPAGAVVMALVGRVLFSISKHSACLSESNFSSGDTVSEVFCSNCNGITDMQLYIGLYQVKHLTYFIFSHRCDWRDSFFWNLMFCHLVNIPDLSNDSSIIVLKDVDVRGGCLILLRLLHPWRRRYYGRTFCGESLIVLEKDGSLNHTLSLRLHSHFLTYILSFMFLRTITL